MRARFFIFVAFILLLFNSCNNDKKDTVKTKKPILKHLHNSNSKRSDTLLINSRSAISVLLDTATLNKRRRQYGDEAFETGADDDMNYSYIADSVLKAKGLPIIDAINYKYLQFIQNSGATTLVKIDTLSQIYNLYFFDPSKAPYNTDVTIIEDEYNKFYH